MPSRSWPQPCGRRHDARHHVARSARRPPRTSPTRERTRTVAPSATPTPRGIVRMDQQRAARLALHQPLAVVQPGVVAAHVAAADQHQRGRRLGQHRRGSAARSAGRARARAATRRPASPVAAAGSGCERPEVDAVRRLAQRAARSSPAAGDPAPRAADAARRARQRRRAVSAQPRYSASVGAGAQHQVELAVGTQPAREPPTGPAPTARAVPARAAEAQREFGEDLVRRAARPLASRTAAASTSRRCARRSRSARCRSDCARAGWSAAGSGARAAWSRSGTGPPTP